MIRVYTTLQAIWILKARALTSELQHFTMAKTPSVCNHIRREIRGSGPGVDWGLTPACCEKPGGLWP